jgi:hypothetical protein
VGRVGIEPTTNGLKVAGSTGYDKQQQSTQRLGLTSSLSSAVDNCRFLPASVPPVSRSGELCLRTRQGQGDAASSRDERRRQRFLQAAQAFLDLSQLHPLWCSLTSRASFSASPGVTSPRPASASRKDNTRAASALVSRRGTSRVTGASPAGRHQPRSCAHRFLRLRNRRETLQTCASPRAEARDTSAAKLRVPEYWADQFFGLATALSTANTHGLRKTSPWPAMTRSPFRLKSLPSENW